MLFDDSYMTIDGISTAEFRDRGSRFIAVAYPIQSETAVKAILQATRKEHPQANHVCYAFRMTTDPTVLRSSDDREPSGSAGKPILAAIQSKGLTDTLVVVIRYFGGTLLGVPGLINAYRSAAAAAIEKATIREKWIMQAYVVSFTYELTSAVHQLLQGMKAHILGQSFGESCSITFEVRLQLTEKLETAHRLHPVLAYRSHLEKTKHAST